MIIFESFKERNANKNMKKKRRKYIRFQYNKRTPSVSLCRCIWKFILFYFSLSKPLWRMNSIFSAPPAPSNVEHLFQLHRYHMDWFCALWINATKNKKKCAVMRSTFYFRFGFGPNRCIGSSVRCSITNRWEAGPKHRSMRLCLGHWGAWHCHTRYR